MKKHKDLPTREIVKTAVRAIWKKSPHLKIAHIYEKVSHLYGYKNWDTFSGILYKQELNKAQQEADIELNCQIERR